MYYSLWSWQGDRISALVYNMPLGRPKKYWRKLNLSWDMPASNFCWWC